MKQFSNRNSSRRRFTLNLRKCKTILRPNLINQNISRFDKNESKTSKRLHLLKIEKNKFKNMQHASRSFSNCSQPFIHLAPIFHPSKMAATVCRPATRTKLEVTRRKA